MRKKQKITVAKEPCDCQAKARCTRKNLDICRFGREVDRISSLKRAVPKGGQGRMLELPLKHTWEAMKLAHETKLTK
jgi:hypothetical protein